MLAVQQLKLDIKLAAYLCPTDVLTDDQLVSVDATGWVIDIPYMNSTNNGVSGVLGGTSADFYNDFKRKIGSPPAYTSALIAANLMAYTEAVKAAGTINSTSMSNFLPCFISNTHSVIKQTLTSMGALNTFWGLIDFAENGTNIDVKYNTVQYLNKRPVLIEGKQAIVYPAPFPWKEKADNKQNIGLIVGVVVGVGSVAIIVVVIGVLFIQRQVRIKSVVFW